MHTIFLLIRKNSFLPALLIVLTGFVHGQNSSNDSHDVELPEEYRSRFRYLIVRDTSEPQFYVNSIDKKTLNLDVFLDDCAFTEINLRELFSLLKKRYKTYEYLDISVFTDLKAIRTPEEYDRTGLWGPKPGYKEFKYAIYMKNGYGERYIYTIPGKVSEKEIKLN